MARFITFRLDDGFINGATKVAEYLAPSHASFFVVTGLISGTHNLDHIDLFRGKDFGSIGQWQALANAGHDVQPHSVSHANFTTLTVEQQLYEIRESLAIVRRIHRGPYVFGFPHNIMMSLNMTSLGLSAAGFHTVASDCAISFNSLNDQIDLFSLRSWAVREQHFDSIVDQIENNLPDQSWTILAFHSLDGEGHEPWSSEGFSRLVATVRSMDLQIISVARMVEVLKEGFGGCTNEKRLSA